MSQQPVFAEVLTVVRGHDREAIARVRVRVDRAQDLSDLPIGGCHVTEVEPAQDGYLFRGGEAAAQRFRDRVVGDHCLRVVTTHPGGKVGVRLAHLVGIVRVVEVDEEEVGPRVLASPKPARDPADHVEIHERVRAPPDRFSSLEPVDRVVRVESLIETGERCDEGVLGEPGRLVARVTQRLRERLDGGREHVRPGQTNAVLVGAKTRQE